LTLEDLPEPSDGKNAVVVLAGANGTGKSSVLDALSDAFARSYGYQFDHWRDATQHHFELELALHERERLLCIENLNNERLNSHPAPKASRQALLARAAEYLEAHRSYIRTNRNDKDHDLDLHNTIHTALSKCVTSERLGFYISANRSYKNESYKSPWRKARLEERDSATYLRHLSFRSHAHQFQELHDYILYLEDRLVTRLEAIGAELRNASDEDIQSALLAEQSDLLTSRPTASFVKLFNELLDPLTLEVPSITRNPGAGEQSSDLRVHSPFSEAAYNLFSLSNGEKEAFFLAAYFLRQKVTQSIICIDEPEVHLHPELARRLARRFALGGDGNQIWLATHNPEIISQTPLSGIRFLVAETSGVRVIAPSNEEKATAFRALLGNCGYSLTDQDVLFLEGANSSIDKDTYEQLLGREFADVRLTPVGDCENATSLNRATMLLLGSTIAGVQFSTVRDRDYLDEATIQRMVARYKDAVFVLPCHEVENLLLDASAIAEVLSSKYFNRRTTQATIKEAMHVVACQISGKVVRDLAAFRMNRKYKPYDYGMGNAFQGLNVLQNRGGEALAAMRSEFVARAVQVERGVAQELSSEESQAAFDGALADVKQWLSCDDYLRYFPGKELLRLLLRGQGIAGEPRAAIMLIAESATLRNAPSTSVQALRAWLAGRRARHS